MAIGTIQYPDIVAQFAGFLGGGDFKLDADTYKITLGNVRELDLSGVSTTDNISEATAKVYDLFSLSDKLIIKGYFWYSDFTHAGVTYQNCLNIRAKLYNRTTGQSKYTTGAYPSGSDKWPVGFCDGVESGVSGTRFFRCQAPLLDTYKAKMCLVTEYMDNIALHPNGFGVIMTLPTFNTVFPATIQSWDHIRRGFMGSSKNPSHWATMPADSIYYPYDGSRYEVLWISDLDHFKNWCTDYDPDFNIDDIIDIGQVGDPVQELDPSEPGGGEGSWDDTSDPADFPTLPEGGAVACGAVKVWNPSATALKDLFIELWDTSLFDIATFQKLVDNPMDCIISLHAIPVIPQTSGTAEYIRIGNYDSHVGSQKVTSQYKTIDCGSIKIPEYWGNALDYNPYTKCSIYLPFIGIKDLNNDDVTGKTIAVKYNVDIVNGDCVAQVKCGQSVLYKFSGNLKQDIPVTGQNSNIGLKAFQGTLAEVGGAIMGTAVGGPMGAAIAGGATLSAVSSVTSSKITTQRSGSLSGNFGILDDFVPYLIFHRPVQSLAKDFKKFKGYPSNITSQLSSLSGYTEVEYINLQNIPNATSAEMDEIKNLLRQGVLI